jgi:hypothetical protein
MSVPVRDYLTTLQSTLYIFETITSFTAAEFEELCAAVCPVILFYPRATGEIRGLGGRPPKLTPEQRLLNFVTLLKHDNTATFDSCQWNWSRTSVNDDSLFVASCINLTYKNEVKWPDANQRAGLAKQIPQLPGCIGFTDGTLSHFDGRFVIHCTAIGSMDAKNVLYEQYCGC